MQQNSLDWLTK